MAEEKKSKLGLDFAKVEAAKMSAARIAEDVQQFVDGYTTVAVERTIARWALTAWTKTACPCPT